jgi:hypothetical protein
MLELTIAACLFGLWCSKGIFSEKGFAKLDTFCAIFVFFSFLPWLLFSLVCLFTGHWHDIPNFMWWQEPGEGNPP